MTKEKYENLKKALDALLEDIKDPVSVYVATAALTNFKEKVEKALAHARKSVEKKEMIEAAPVAKRGLEKPIEPFAFLGVVVSVLRAGKTTGVFVYTGKSSEHEALIPTEFMRQQGMIMHGDWVDFNAKFINNRFIVTKYKLREPACKTVCVRNTVKLLLTAFVPQNYAPERNDLNVVVTEFVSIVADDKLLVKPNMINKYIAIWAIKENRSEGRKITWQIESIQGFAKSQDE